MTTVRMLIVAGVTAGLMACGGGSVDSGPMDPPGTDPFPLAEGSEWTYKVTSPGDSVGVQVVWRVSDLVVSGSETTVTWDASSGVPIRLRRTATEIVQLPSTSSNLDAAIGPITVLKLPLTVGARWTPFDGVIKLNGSNELKVKITFEVVSTVDVVTPQGSYHGAYVVRRSDISELSYLSAPGASYTTDWIVPGIGVVKRATSSIPLGGVRPHEAVFELVAYRPRPR